MWMPQYDVSPDRWSVERGGKYDELLPPQVREIVEKGDGVNLSNGMGTFFNNGNHAVHNRTIDPRRVSETPVTILITGANDVTAYKENLRVEIADLRIRETDALEVRSRALAELGGE